MDRNV